MEPHVTHKNRRYEQPGHHFRSGDRCFVANGYWYIATREGIDLGPFPTRAAADAAVSELMELLDRADDATAVEAFLRQFATRIDGSANQDGE
jgi:Domain of unknown function (DUF6316)